MEIARTVAHTPTYPGPGTLIQTFPSELLLIIFKFAYVAARRRAIRDDFPCFKDVCEAEEKCYCYMEPSDECDEYDDDDEPIPSTLFPNSIASVCSRWGELMRLVPVFWTRVVILLDADVFSPTDLKSQLRSSGDRPFDVIVTRTSFSDAAGLKVVERSRMAQTIMALHSHFQRCRTLRITVIHSSSLPHLLAVLPSDMPHLRTLSLESHIDSGRPGVEPYCFVDRATPFIWCNLTTIMIDGWNLSGLHDRNATLENYISSECRSLSVKFGDISSMSIRRLIEGGPLELLEVESVTFTPGTNLVTSIQGDNPIHSPNLNTVTLKNLDRETTAKILPYVCALPFHLTIDRCVLPKLFTLESTGSLSLRNIGLDQGLGDCMRSWGGGYLEVTRCPGFDDDALRKWGNVDNDNDNQPHPHELTIVGCHSFSVVALKKLVERTSSRYETKLTGLHVYEAEFPLSEEDFRWFKQRISSFWWEDRRPRDI